jgi:SprT protein
VKKEPLKRREQVKGAFSKYLPDAFVDEIVELFLLNPVRFKIVKGRKTKLGDFRAGINGEKHQISINGDLNPYAFLITTLHEFAHLLTFETYRNRVAPHGKEWKDCFRGLLLPIIGSKALPKDIEEALIGSLINTKASSCTDHNLSRVLHKYDKPKEGIELLETLPKNAVFTLNGKQFIKGPLRRKRYICQEIDSNRSFLVNALAQVQLIQNYQ